MGEPVLQFKSEDHLLQNSFMQEGEDNLLI